MIIGARCKIQERKREGEKGEREDRVQVLLSEGNGLYNTLITVTIIKWCL